jgi:hypothetical protein
LLAELVDINHNNNIEEEHLRRLYKRIPSIIIDFANRSRLDTGFRLVKRAIRHYDDPETLPIFEAKASVIRYHGEIGFYINHSIKASMKQDVYNVEVSFTMKKIIACKCSCKAGSSSNEKIICVHILPILLQLGQQVFDGLADHILVEFTSRITENIDTELGFDDKKNYYEP